MTRTLTDSAKIIAAIAVVGIHATSNAENGFALRRDFFCLDFAGVVLNQWARFSVPLFLYLSAYGLAVSYKEKNENFPREYFSFLLKRLPTILIPYLTFSAIAFALNSQNLTPGIIIRLLLTGGADYHLYFLVILLQCYLLFPVALRLHDRYPGGFRVLVLLLFFIVITFLYKTTSEKALGFFGMLHPGWHASFSIYWLPYFFLGILHGRRQPRPWGGGTAFAACGIALAFVLADYLYYSRQGTPVDYYNHFSRPTVALYALAVIYLLHAWGERAAGMVRRVAPLAGLTFTVYLIHPQILRLLSAFVPLLPSLLAWLITAVSAFILVYGLKKVLEKIESPPVRFIQRALGLR